MHRGKYSDYGYCGFRLQVEFDRFGNLRLYKNENIGVTAMKKGTNKRFKAYGGTILTIRRSSMAEVDAGKSKSTECFYVMDIHL